MIQARHALALPAVSKNTGWSFTWSLAIGDAATPATLPDATVVRLAVRHQAMPRTVIECDGYVSRDGAVIQVDVPREVTQTVDWLTGMYDGQLRLVDPGEPVDLWDIRFELPVVEGIGE